VGIGDQQQSHGTNLVGVDARHARGKCLTPRVPVRY
jgi:hypothetical protein